MIPGVWLGGWLGGVEVGERLGWSLELGWGSLGCGWVEAGLGWVRLIGQLQKVEVSRCCFAEKFILVQAASEVDWLLASAKGPS